MKSIPSHGYHRLARDVSLETGWVFSHNLAHKCCKAAGIHSRARKGRYRRTGEESIVFPNRVRGHWNAAAPLQLVVSDMTILKVGTTYWEWTILLDTFNNEILAHSVTSQRGSNKPYYHCLEQLKKLMDKREEQTSQVILHTGQGAVYSSRAFARPTTMITTSFYVARGNSHGQSHYRGFEWLDEGRTLS